MPKFFLIYFPVDNTTVVLSKEDFIDYNGEGLVGDTVKVKYSNDVFTGKILFAANDKKSVGSHTIVPTFPSRKRQRLSKTPPKSTAPLNHFTDDQISFLEKDFISQINASPILHNLDQNVKVLNEEMMHCFRDMTEIKEATSNMAKSMKNFADLLFRMAKRTNKESHEQETQTDEVYVLTTDYTTSRADDPYNFYDENDYALQTINTQINQHAMIESSYSPVKAHVYDSCVQLNIFSVNSTRENVSLELLAPSQTKSEIKISIEVNVNAISFILQINETASSSYE
ncbi:unnamed protein product [Didymodactylos carnosus]|uniref:Uncharacterized protein n=1 Tax=Didymodactylos carnosus TaxID=1234261 RepID=A0A8S2DQE9_9BILA|nr:unnamed protein product [Didymodactylos carnosus]CAF3754787.1 unnamed protein product [Didymodactylos carnosus]